MNTPTKVLPVLVMSAACGGDDPGLPGARPLDCQGDRETRTFRVDEIRIPTNGAEVEIYGTDLDGDGSSDNNAGHLLAWITGVYPDLEAAIEARLAARLAADVDWRIGIEHCDGEVRVSLGNQDRAGDVPAAGTWSSPHDPGLDYGELGAERGQGLAPLGALADLADTGFDAWHPTYPTTIEMWIVSTGASGRVMGGIGPGFLPIVAEAAQPYFQAKLDAGETGWFSEADRNGDGELTIDEIQAAPEWQVLTRPDLEDDGLSFGFVIEATALD
jgi:hypothetical protein